MKKVVLIFGVVYATLGILFLQTARGMLDLYQQFDTQLPIATHIGLAFYFLLPFLGIAQIIIYFRKLKNVQVYKLLFILDLIIVFLGINFFTLALVLPVYNLTTAL